MEHVTTKTTSLPLIGLGTFSLTAAALRSNILSALGMGCDLFDTACKYGNEQVIGQTLKASGYKRSNYLIQTKLHPELLLGNLRYFRLNGLSVRKGWKRACQRLGVSYIDILMLHAPFAGYEKRMEQLAKLKEEGAIRFTGLCNASLAQLKSLEEIGLLPDVVQVEVHPYHSNRDVIDFCQERGRVVEARSPFAHGDAIEEWGHESVLQRIAKKYNATIPQVILRWITQQNVVALPRTSSPSHLKENIESLQLHLTQQDMAAINALDKGKSFGFISSRQKV